MTPLSCIKHRLAAALCCIPCLLLAKSHIDFSFTDYPKGELITAATTPWRISVEGGREVRATVVRENGVPALRVQSTGGGGLTFSSATNNAYRTSALTVQPGMTIRWTLDWKVPMDADPHQQVLIRLDDGQPAGGHFLAGFGLTQKGIVYMTDPNFEPISQQMTILPKDAITVEPGQWYRATFQLQISEERQITSTLTIQEKDGAAAPHTVDAVYTPSEIKTNDGIVRMIISVAEGTDLLIGDFQLSSK